MRGSSRHWVQHGLLLSLLGLAVMGMFGCQPGPKQLIIEVDNSRRAVNTDTATVREALAVAGVELGKLDRVQPDLYVETTSGMVIVVTRVEERIETQREPLPFARKTVINEALPAGETRAIQLGANGEAEVTYRRILENGVEVERTELQRNIIKPPVDEILAVGAPDKLPAVSISGTLAYLSAGNAWLMRGSSAARRPLTTAGDLDGRVFELSPDGRHLLFSRRLVGDVKTPINQLWLADTTIVGESPISLPIRGALYAEWSPDGSRLAYSTAERSASPPGWRANNDLWIVRADRLISGSQSLRAEPVLTTSAPGAYSWWGSTFRWAPDGQRLAYAGADQVGVVDVISRSRRVLVEFPAYRTYSEWVWTPNVSWSPDGRFLATVVHGAPLANEDPQDSPAFELWLLAADGSFSARVADQVGMWAAPSWGAAGVLYGQATNPLQSVDSRYALMLRDRDGSNPRRVFPVGQEPGVEAPPQLVWAPNGQEFLFVFNGNLYLGDVHGAVPRQLTANNQSASPRWVAGP